MSKRVWQLISLFADILFINLGIIAAFLIRFEGTLPLFNFRAYSNLAVFITLIQVGCLYFYDIYLPERTEGFSSIFSAIFKAVTLGTLATVTLTFFVGFFSFPRSVFIISWLLLIILLTGWRLLSAEVLRIDWPEQRVLVVGTGELSRQVVRELKARSEWGYRIIGVVARKQTRVGHKMEGVSIIGVVGDLAGLIKKNRADRVIVTTPIKQRELLEEMARSQEADVKVEIVPDLYEIFIGTVDHDLLSDIPLVTLTKELVPAWVSLIKSVFDRVVAFLLLLLTSPIFLIISLLVKLSSPGPVIFKQERIGKDQKIFYQLKFRTMVQNAEEMTGPVLATENDPRITRIGHFLRRYRLDELPQLVNILEGNMSFVGPRPERPYFVEKFKKTIPGYAERFRIKPGLTGLAQVNGSYATTAANKLKYDLIYIYHQSFILDLKILFNTIRVVLNASGSRGVISE